MTDLRAAFRELLVSPAKLAQCANAASMAELLALLKQWWRLERLGDQQLIGELNACNRRPLDLAPEMLAPHWLPWRYHAKTQTLSWCLPQGRPTEPFFDQFIERCRQLPVNQFLQPKTALKLASGSNGHRHTPAGFIFHVSRCGSTLVSGCLAELERARVLSESPALTDALLDPGLLPGGRGQLLEILLDSHGGDESGQKAIIVKWNAWDLFHWPLIRARYPQVPALLLIRDPLEVLASHRRLAGRHMAGDPSLAGVNPVFAGMLPGERFPDFRIRVLRALFEAMLEISREPGVSIMDYTLLNAERIRSIGRYFGVTASDDEHARIRRRMQFHAKEPGREFRPDQAQKQQAFNSRERDTINQTLTPLYRRLLTLTHSQPKEAVAC
jgi:hypothetical protein